MSLNLTDLRSRWRIPAVLAVTLQAARLSVDYVRRENGGSRVLRSLSLPLRADAILEDPERAGRELAALLEGAGIRERACVVCVPPGWAVSTGADFPEIAAEDLPSYLELRAEREFPMPASELLLTYSAYQVSGGGRKATVAGLPRRKADAVRRMLETARCRALSISLALEAGWAEESQDRPGGVNVIVNGDHVDIVVVTGGGVAALRSLPLPEWSADAGEGAVPGDRIGRELRITLGRLPAPVRGDLQKARFVGPRQSAESLLEHAQDHLRRLGLQGIVPTGRGEGGAQHESGAEPSGLAVTVAERHLQGRPVLFEFVAPERTRWQIFLRRYDTRRHRWLAAAVIGCVVLPALLFFVRARVEAGLGAKWAGMEKTVQELDSIQAQLRQFRPWFSNGSPSVEALAGLVSAFPDAGEVWASRIELKEASRLSCGGFARSQSAWMDFLDRLGKQPGVTDLQVSSVRGDNPVQFEFSLTWNPRDGT